MDKNELFEVLGYLASPLRQCKLDAEMLEKAQKKFEEKYFSLTELTPRVNNVNYFILYGSTNKWGVVMRIYFNANASTIPRVIQNKVVRPWSRAKKYNSRINDNNLIWQLIEYGFLLNDTQDVARIKGRVPRGFIPDFERGISTI